jgi:hypothetical protein
VKGARHERIVLDGIAEDDELRAADAVAVGGQFRRFTDDIADAQTLSVVASARGIDVMSAMSPGVLPLCTSAE